jgi:hypothetical protein
LLLLVGLGAALIWLAVTRVRRFTDAALRMQIAALAAPLVAIFALSFASPTTVSAPTAPFLWFVAGVLGFWLIRPGPEASQATVAGRDGT